MLLLGGSDCVGWLLGLGTIVEYVSLSFWSSKLVGRAKLLGYLISFTQVDVLESLGLTFWGLLVPRVRIRDLTDGVVGWHKRSVDWSCDGKNSVTM